MTVSGVGVAEAGEAVSVIRNLFPSRFTAYADVSVTSFGCEKLASKSRFGVPAIGVSGAAVIETDIRY